MDRLKLAKTLSIIVMIAGIMVMVGWIFDIDFLKGILPVWITMKFTTAISFLLSGISLYFIARSQETRSSLAPTILPVTSTAILLMMVIPLFSTFLGIPLGIEDLFIRDVKGSVSGWFAGRPSVLTMIDFILISLAGILAMLELKKLGSKLLRIGWIILTIGGIAVTGYLFNLPLLRYDIRGWSNPMACHTSILFVILGANLILLGRRNGE